MDEHRARREAITMQHVNPRSATPGTESPRGRARGALARAGLDLVYLSVGLLTSIAAFTVWVTGLSVTLSLAVFIVGIPVLVGTALAFRLVADVGRHTAQLALGVPLEARYRDQAGLGLWARVTATVRDPQTWRDLAWLIGHSVIGFALGVAALSVAGTVAGLATLPLWYWSLPDGAEVVASWKVNTLPEALLVALLAVALAPLVVALLRVMAVGESRFAASLLGPTAAAAADVAPRAQPRQPRDPRAMLAMHAAVASLIGLVATLVWGLTGANDFWPAWVWLGLILSVALHRLVGRAIEVDGDPVGAYMVKVELCGVIAVLCVAIWALAGGGYLWPVWPVLGMSAALAARGLLVFRHRLPWVRERALVERVDVLTRTRRGALDVQATELRRIERDLHDGAQARLVALSMQLGRAEERLDDGSEAAELIRSARGEASAAIAELRDLARGIAPPVLADRGLAAAVDSLARRAVVPVDVDVAVGRRPPPTVETAAYFVVAEALTNVAKHAPDAVASVTITLESRGLIVVVADDGPGEADPRGGGLTGLRHRVEALDGMLSVVSPPGGGTTIRTELPCG